MYRYRSVFISDVHLGSSDCQAEYLLDFLEHVQCQKLYLVGDILDLIAMERRMRFPPSHQAVIAKLVALANNGVDVIYVPGNHDVAMRNFCGQSLAGIDVRSSAIHENADGRRFVVCHGDQFDQVVRYSPLLLLVGERAHEFLLWLNRGCHAWRRMRKKPYWSLAAWLKQRIGKAQAFIRRFEQAALTAAERDHRDGFICGHIHVAGFRQGKNGLYCNDGDWVEHCTALTEGFDGALEILHWSENPRVVAREPKPLRQGDEAPETSPLGIAV